MKYTAAEVGEQVKLAIAGGYAIVFKDLMTELNPSWEDVLNLIDAGYNDTTWDERPSGNPKIEPAVGRLTIRGKFYVTVRLDSFGQPFTQMLPGFNFLREAVAADVRASHTVFGIAANEYATETAVHNDPVHTFYWQMQGESLWRLYKDRCCVYCDGRRNFDASELVGPGDLLFLPKELFHTVHVTGPRAATVFRFEHDAELFEVTDPRPEILKL